MPNAKSLTCEGSNIPRNIVAPADGLNPVNSACVQPHQVPGTLNESVHRHVGVVQVLQVGPPGTQQEVDVVPAGQAHTPLLVPTLEMQHLLNKETAVKGSDGVFSGDALFTEVVDDAPVRLRHSKPFTVPRADVDVD